MNTPEHDLQADALRSIAASLKGIQYSLDKLTGAVEGVSESIETAHQPEGDLGVHLVHALKELTSSLHKRAQQERGDRQQRPQQQQNQNRRDERPPRRGDESFAEHPEIQVDPDHRAVADVERTEHTVTPETQSQVSREHSPAVKTVSKRQPRRPGPNRGRRATESRPKPQA